MNAKERATGDMHDWHLFRRYTELKAEIAALKGESPAFSPRPDANELCVPQQFVLRKGHRSFSAIEHAACSAVGLSG